MSPNAFFSSSFLSTLHIRSGLGKYFFFFFFLAGVGQRKSVCVKGSGCWTEGRSGGWGPCRWNGEAPSFPSDTNRSWNRQGPGFVHAPFCPTSTRAFFYWFNLFLFLHGPLQRWQVGWKHFLHFHLCFRLLQLLLLGLLLFLVRLLLLLLFLLQWFLLLLHLLRTLLQWWLWLFWLWHFTLLRVSLLSFIPSAPPSSFQGGAFSVADTAAAVVPTCDGVVCAGVIVCHVCVTLLLVHAFVMCPKTPHDQQ